MRMNIICCPKENPREKDAGNQRFQSEKT